MANLNLLPKDWTIDRDGKTYAYGTKWLPIKPVRGKDLIIPRPRYDIEMLCFKALRGLTVPKGFIIPPGVRTPYDHYKAISDEIWGVEDSIWPFEWNPYSERMLDFKLRYNFLMICGHQRSGKCLALNTKVLKYDGSIVRAGDVQVGDQLMGDDGLPRNVLVTNPGRSSMVRIVPYVGEDWECNDDHILTLKKSCRTCKSGKAGKNIGRPVGTVLDLSVKEYLKKGQTFKTHWKLFSVGVEFPEQPLEFDPQIYGIWLGDGTTGKPHITSSDKEVEVNRFMCRYFLDKGYRVARGKYSNDDCPTYRFSVGGGRTKRNPFLDFVRESSGTLGRKWKHGESQGGEKRILKRYLINSRENRLKLLAGILDADGYAAGTFFEIACSLDGLTEDIAFLARSLGFRVSVTPRSLICNGKKCYHNRINILGDVQEIPTLRKKCSPKKPRRTGSQDCTGFKVEQIGEGDWSGFTVDGNGRYLLGDFTVTHNSDMIAHWLVNNFLFDPYNTKCLATSLTLKSARGKIWGKISECWQQACRRVSQIYGFSLTEGEKYMPGKLLNAGIIKYSMDGVETEQAGLELVPGDETKARESSEKIQGYHRNRMFAGLDELASLSHGLMKTVKTNIFTDDQADVTGSFNPDSFFDPAGIACEPVEGGYKILTPDLMDWKIAGGWCIRFRGSSSPNMSGSGEQYKYLLSREEYESKKLEMGEKSKEFCKMYEGTFSTTGTVEAIYDENEIIQYRGQQSITEDKLWYEEPQWCSFLDASYAHGGDWASMAIGKIGWARIGGKRILVLEIQGDPTRLDADIDVKKDKSEQVVAAYIALNKKLGIQPKNSGVDISGNPTIYSLIARDWSKDILQLNFGEAASENPISRTDQRPAKERYVRKVSEIWYAGKPLIRSEQLKGLTPTVILEMCNRTYKEVNGRIQVETKDDMRQRSLRSPDNADAVLGLAYLCRDRMGLVAEERSAGSVSGSAYRRGAIAPKVARNLAKCSGRLSVQYGNGKALWKR